jgi:hypothetical protein
MGHGAPTVPRTLARAAVDWCSTAPGLRLDHHGPNLLPPSKAAISDGKSGAITRGALAPLVTVCAEFLVERIVLAGLVVMRSVVI